MTQHLQPLCIWCDKTRTRTCCGATATREMVGFLDAECAEQGIVTGQVVCRACLDEVWYIRAWLWTLRAWHGTV